MNSSFQTISNYSIEIFNRLKDVPTFLSQIVSLSTTYDEINRIQKFAEENGLDSKIIVKNALKDAKFNLKWTTKNVPIIMDIIKKIL